MKLFHDVCNAFVRVSDGRALSGEELKEAERLVWAVDMEGHRTRLSGEALANALAARGWGICGHKVSKKARQCGWCGKGAPGGWIKCPQCGKWVGNDSQYCPHCDHPLHPSERIDLAGGVWDRDPECYAQRFELDDVRFLKENGLLVQEGTSAILLDGGNEVKVLGAGRHSPTGTLRAINWFGNPPPRSAVMVDSGDVVFRIVFEADTAEGPSIRSAEELPVNAAAEITIRFLPSKAEAFMQNFMKDRRKITAKEVCQFLYQEALSVVRDICLQSKIEDLVKDPNRCERFGDAVSRTLKEPLARCGLEVICVAAVEFWGKDYEDMRVKYGELDRQRRLVEYEKLQLELIAEIDANDDDHKKSTAKREYETAEYLAQLAQEKDLGDIAHTEELQIAVRVAKGNVSAEDARQQLARQAELHAIEMKGLTNKLELDAIVTDYDLADRIKKLKNDFLAAEVQNNIRVANEEVNRSIAKQEAENKAVILQIEADARVSIKKLESDAEIDETMRWLQAKKVRMEIDLEIQAKHDELDEKKKQAEFNRKLLFLRTVAGMPIEIILTVIDDQAIRNDVIRMKELNVQVDLFKMQSTMSWEQLLGLAANNPNAATAAAGANALARMAEAGEKASQQALSVYREAETVNNRRIDDFVRQIHDIALQSATRPSPVEVIQPPPPTIMQH